MAKTKVQKVNIYAPKPKKSKGKHSKKNSNSKSSKNYVKPYRGQGR